MKLRLPFTIDRHLYGGSPEKPRKIFLRNSNIQYGTDNVMSLMGHHEIKWESPQTARLYSDGTRCLEYYKAHYDHTT
jgi:hypothetical protein